MLLSQEAVLVACDMFEQILAVGTEHGSRCSIVLCLQYILFIFNKQL